MPPVETAAFAGTRVSRLIKGGWQLHEAHGRIDRDRALADMDAFADAGIATFETADSYRGVDELIGAFLARRRAEGRPPVRVHTRLSVPAAAPFGAGEVRAAVDRTRAALGLARLDLVQLAMWQFDEARWRSAARHVADLRADGAIALVGVMNVDAGPIAALRADGVPVASAQAQCSLLDRRPERALLPYCRDAGLGFFAYGALAGGLIGERWLGRPDPGPDGPVHREYRLTVEAFGGWDLFQRLLAALDRVAQRHGASIPGVALRWVLDRPGVTAVLVGARDATHLPDLLRVAALRLGDQDNADIHAVLAASRGPAGEVGELERDPSGPFARAIAARALSP